MVGRGEVPRSRASTELFWKYPLLLPSQLDRKPRPLLEMGRNSESPFVIDAALRLFAEQLPSRAQEKRCPRKV